jgi:DAK2 domain fusion protein YloV
MLLHTAVQLLAQRSVSINALNVFPVPDGDTGTNMLLTMRAAVHASDDPIHVTVSDVATAVARGALMGARGNSGVILSQYLRGLARGLAGCSLLDGETLAGALAEAAAAARAAVGQPVEGTILTVGHDLAQAAVAAATPGVTLISILDAIVEAGRESVTRTQEILPILCQANVVDAGAMGLLTLFEGMRLAARDEPLPPPTDEKVSLPVATRLGHDTYGYCTEFLVHGETLDTTSLRLELSELGNSLLVVGDPSLVRVHLHTSSPGRAIDLALARGSVDQIKIDDMQAQNRRLRECDVSSDAAAISCAVIAVVAGDGFRDLFRSLGAAVVPGGQTINPSTEEILAVVRSVVAEQYVILPNNGNAVLAARQALSLSDRPLAIVPTSNQAEGVTAALAFQPRLTADENADLMRRSLADLRTGQVTTAVRAAKLAGREIFPGAILGLIDDQIAAVGRGLAEVVLAVLSQLGAAQSEVVTLYAGAGVSANDAEGLRSVVQSTFPNRQVELIHGGQPHYLYILACE